MAEPVPASDETAAVNASETVAVPNPASPGSGGLAWSRDDDEESPPQPAVERESWVTTWRKAGALLLGGLVLAGAIVVGFWVLSPDNKGSQAPPSASPTPTAGASPTATASPSAASPSSIPSTPEQDNKYVQTLNDRGISFANPEAAIYNGKMVCADIRQGMTVPQIVDAFRASNPALGADADAYVAISVRAYCPQNGNLVSGVS
ncbi:hypothetical protein MSAS_51230 [Mycobacterium saskatchewanense]|uniref:DUF732 domain-containing protein n=1 Tax=Mycobacterium saskatchewanense TaxID=220927 RepID=A0AAJ3TVS4_9MYCO|nr:DUF732 domain-containing protein [Mycobacterium saskatchewanense]ORW72691.1 hypothetical protein AWC23_09615 [Mycobacterium saskatchewanense]BBX65949.1 hypothetical protein MSAS_51230 [Mycobacterium saskatchewanense]